MSVIPTFEVSRIKGGVIPPIPFQSIKNTILGKKYTLSLTFTDTATSTKLHKDFKNKPGPANTLAFPYEQDEGEIIMHLGTIRSQAKLYFKNYHQHLLFMFIHSCLHLKGFDHGEEMELQEQRFYQKFLPDL